MITDSPVWTVQATRYLPRSPAGSGLPRLFCFHHAGGTASAFSGWRDGLAGRAEVVPVQLPGREGRIAEPRVRDLGTLIAELDEQLDPFLTEPFACYGHSMGATVAYHLAARRYLAGRSVPAVLVAAAFPAPHRERRLARLARAGDDELVRWMRDIGGVSELTLRYPDWRREAVALLRDDLLACSRALFSVRLPCPIHVLAGRTDPLVSEVDAQAWTRYTTAGCTLHRLPGGHFFNLESRPQLLELLAGLLGREFG